jgi:hypothetical protein
MNEVLLYDVKFGVCCVMSATRIIVCVCVFINYTYSDTVFEHTPITREPVLLFSKRCYSSHNQQLLPCLESVLAAE